ncbi:MAG: enolase C-terminal domain-like protein [Dehalococcoidia bacterium]|jgi:L-alanine-DL-glutamate epimerase-like enolase superfamily enzyme
MKIIKIECIPVSIRFAKPMKMGLGTAAVSDAVVVKIHTDEGITGICETGDTSLWYMGESQDSIIYNINKAYADILLGEDPFNIEKIIARMDKAVKLNNQSKAVIDYALHDIIGKAHGVPVYTILGGLSNPKIPLAFVMSSGTPKEVQAEGRSLVKAGFKALKLKVGGKSVEEDIEITGALREAVGKDIKIMTDTNGGWNYLEALKFLQGAAEFDLFLSEQPVPWWDMDGLARLRRKVNVPIFADESAAEPSDVLKLVQRDAVDGLFLKVPKAGGIHKSQKWVSIAQAAGLLVMTGCMIDTSLGGAANAHFLAATEWMGKIEQESIGPLNMLNVPDTVSTPLKDFLGKTLLRYEGGFLYPPDSPGLGIELREEALKEIATPRKIPTVVSL